MEGAVFAAAVAFLIVEGFGVGVRMEGGLGKGVAWLLLIEMGKMQADTSRVLLRKKGNEDTAGERETTAHRKTVREKSGGKGGNCTRGGVIPSQR